jgi:hypothetical protein
MAFTTLDNTDEVDTRSVWLPPADTLTPDAIPVAMVEANDNDVVSPVPN